jgi:hypothetical protein
MAAAIKAINAKIRSNSVLDYVCSTRTYRPQFPEALPGPEIGQRRLRPKENKHSKKVENEINSFLSPKFTLAKQ